MRAPSSSVQAPGCGLIPRMWAATCSAGRVQSMRASAVESFAAWVARESSCGVAVAVPPSRASSARSSTLAPSSAIRSSSSPAVSNSPMVVGAVVRMSPVSRPCSMWNTLIPVSR